MSDATRDAVRLREVTARQNWRGMSMPGWVDEAARVYTGMSVTAAGRDWRELVAVSDGGSTTLYLTEHGFDTSAKGPALHRVEGAAYRRCVREWVRDTFRREVEFA